MKLVDKIRLARSVISLVIFAPIDVALRIIWFTSTLLPLRGSMQSQRAITFNAKSFDLMRKSEFLMIKLSGEVFASQK